ncbi:hypothetical protein D8T31_21640 [Vibrio vulnificus]|nr:hypothetical protein D8T42_21420 [Vibrio vulnificus]RZQ72782.1 hypothetical protein D8T31_21640 [Vibrio vulnificus]
MVRSLHQLRQNQTAIPCHSAYPNKRANKAFKSDSQRLAFSLRSSIAKRHSHLNAALCLVT